MQVFYVPGISGKYATLSKTESIHCIIVLRHAVSDTIHLIDGNGGLYKACIIDPDPHACQVEITATDLSHDQNQCKLHIAIAPPKHIDRFGWFIEKAVEVGIDEITPIKCNRSERKEIKPERFEKIIIASMKQAIVAKKPVLHTMITYPQFIRSSLSSNAGKYVACCSETQIKPLTEALVKGNNAILLIGPEGDFTPEEIQVAFDSGYTAVSMGSRRLRTETAAMVGCATFNIINS